MISEFRTPGEFYGRTVYVVDDDKEFCRSIDSLLRSMGYKVELIGSGPELFSLPLLELDGCIVLDVRLSGMSGIEIHRRLIQAQSPLPVIFVTGYGDIRMAVQALKNDAVSFLAKPFRDQDLLDAIAEAMERCNHHARGKERRDATKQRFVSLSVREREMLPMLCQGLIGKQIAEAMGISEGTVKVHRSNLMKKIGVRNVGQLVVIVEQVVADKRLVELIGDKFTDLNWDNITTS